MARRPLVTIAVVLALGIGAGACGGGDDDAVEAPPRDTSTTAASGPTTAPATSPPGSTPPGTVTPDAQGVALDIAFLRGDLIGVAHRRVAPTRAVARAALEQLVAGPDATERAAGLRSTIRPDTSITGLTISDGVATVVLSPEIGRGDSDVTASQARGQVVFTLTQFPTVESVRFGPGGPTVSRDDFAAITPNILVESVAPGDRIASPVEIAGENRTFENNVRMRVLGADRRILADTFTTGTGEMGTWGPFRASVPFTKGSDTTGYVVVFDSSAKDGSMIDLVEIPVRFA
ncbi:MAG: hypothetical protein AMXMBFR46_21130 [Acidimicrobiia bacterium]